MTEKDVSYMHDYLPTSLEGEQVNQVKHLEEELSRKVGDQVILMAFSPKRESWGDY